MTNISSLKNLGPTSAEWLRQVGIHTEEDLRNVGVIQAYKMVEAAGYKPTLNLLWAMVGTLEGIGWDEIPEGMKAQLKKELLS